MSTALSAFDVHAWYAAVKYGAAVEIDSDHMHFRDVCSKATQHQKGVFADELGVGAALLTSQYALDMQYFADVEWFLAGKPLKPTAVFSQFNGMLRRGSSAPDFLIVDSAFCGRLLESKGTFDRNFSGQLVAGKKQIGNVTLKGRAIANGIVAGSKFPDGLQDHRPLTVLCDPESHGREVVFEPEDVARYFFSKILAFLGFHSEGLRLLNREPLIELAETLKEELMSSDDVLPLVRMDDECVFIMARHRAAELYRLAFSSEPPEQAQNPVPRRPSRLVEDLMPIGIGLSIM